MLVIRDATLADGRSRDVRVDQAAGRIDAVGEGLSGGEEEEEEVVDAEGQYLLPGMIDTHVHFREPGGSHKETWTTGSQSAAAGGVTTVVDQPNTDPPTVTGAAFDEKRRLAASSVVDYGINGGVTPGWDPESLFERPLFALGEVFLADSTGEMGIEFGLFREAVERAARAGVRVTVHAEDAGRFDEAARGRDDADAWSAYRSSAAEVAAVERACETAAEMGVSIHIAHTSTPAGIDLAVEHGMTCEVTPHHLFLSREDLDGLGSFGRVNPPLRSGTERAGVFERVRSGVVDMIATDHAPHTVAEKEVGVWEAPSGMPGVETALPLLVAAAARGDLGYERVRELTASGPARVFGLANKGLVAPGYDADLVLLDPSAQREIQGAELHSKCGWTPFEGWEGVFPEWTMVRGRFVYRAGEFGRAAGRNVRDPEPA